MTKWQKRARFVIAIGGVAFLIVVLITLKGRGSPGSVAPAAPTDPGAVVEVTGGRVERFKLSREDVRVAYERQLTFANGSTKLMGVTISSDERLGGRKFVVTADAADVGQSESTMQLNGKVRLTASDGMAVRTEQATYSDKEGVLRAPGAVEFTRGRMTGSGVGMTHEMARDILTILDRAVVHVTPDKTGAGAAEIASGSATFIRPQKSVRFERDVKLQRDRQTIEGDAATMFLSEDESQVRELEVRGRSRIGMGEAAAGGLQGLSATDMDLQYAADGQALERALLTGDSAIVVAGEAGAGGRQIKANTIDVALAPDGATPVGLIARTAVVLTLPAAGAVPERTISSNAMDAKGEPQRGLTGAQFTGNVEFRERGADVNRVARSTVLDVALAPAMAGITDATFTQHVRFSEGDTASSSADDKCASGPSSRFRMCAASIRYDLAKGVLVLTGSEPASPRPRVVNDRIAVDATRIDVALAGPDVKGAGDVKSVVAVAREQAGGSGGAAAHIPSMFKQDRPVNVTADALDYGGAAGRATYTGNAQLWQDDTSIKGPSIVLDDKSGDLAASGGVTTVTVRETVDKNKKAERVRTIATAADFRYEESNRRATYTGKAHMSGTDGDVTADRIELFLKAGGAGGGNDLERAEGYDNVTLRDRARTTTGNRLSYTTVDERYVVTGAPVKIVDECRRETIGRTLTYLKASDTVTIDGNLQTRTQTKGAGQCP